jgi:enamine deaminase RidA (YjgF/YER057c/UK114 family)
VKLSACPNFVKTKSFMKKMTIALLAAVTTTMSAWAQTKQSNQMEKRIINPWKWQDARNYVQAVEVKNVTGTLYVSGQAAIHSDGTSSDADMKTQLILAIENLEKVIAEAGYEPKNIIRLNIYTTSSAELWPHFNILQDWIAKHGMKQAVTFLEVRSLFETLSIELEATVVK